MSISWIAPKSRPIIACSSSDRVASAWQQFNPALHRIELESTPPYRDCWLGYHRDLRRLGRLRALIDMLVSSAEATSSVFTTGETDNTRARHQLLKRSTANQ
jgi:hypothetical protein